MEPISKVERGDFPSIANLHPHQNYLVLTALRRMERKVEKHTDSAAISLDVNSLFDANSLLALDVKQLVHALTGYNTVSGFLLSCGMRVDVYEFCGFNADIAIRDGENYIFTCPECGQQYILYPEDEQELFIAKLFGASCNCPTCGVIPDEVVDGLF